MFSQQYERICIKLNRSILYGDVACLFAVIFMALASITFCIGGGINVYCTIAIILAAIAGVGILFFSKEEAYYRKCKLSVSRREKRKIYNKILYIRAA